MTTGDRRLRVLLVDDRQPLLRAGLRAAIGHAPDLELVGEAQDAREAVRAAAPRRADVIVLDRHAAGDGLAVLPRLRATAPGTRVLVLGESDDLPSALAAVRAGAWGYVLNTAGEEEIRSAIRAVGRGHVTFGDRVAERVLEHLTTATAGQDAFPELTAREREVLHLLARGAGTATIARAVHLAPKTVRNYVSAICAKLGVADRTQAALLAREAGYGQSA